MKSLLLKRKKDFFVYLLACLFPIVNQFSGNIAFALLLGSVTASSLSEFYPRFALALVLVVATSLIFIASRFLRIRFMRDTLLDVRMNAFDKLLGHSFERFNQQSKAVYVSNLVNDVNLIEQNFFIRLLNIIFRGGTYVVSLIVLAVLDLKFAIVLFLASVGIFLFTHYFEDKTVRMQEKVSTLNEAFTVDISNTMDGMEILKLNQIEKPFLNKTMGAIENVERQKFKFECFTGAQRSMTRFLAMLVFVGNLVYLISRVNEGVSITQISFMVMVANGCIWPLEQVMPMINELKASVKIYDKISKMNDDSQMQEVGSLPFCFENAIEIKGLTFAYENEPVLRDVNLSIEKGKKYLIKGASGSGKSTLMKLLAKSYTQYEGDILVDGNNLRDVSFESFNDRVSFVYQDVFLFEDTIKQNITLYRDVETHMLEKAVVGAGLSDFIYATPEGIDRVLADNGKDLSGGQRQRLSIARALVKSVDIVFADEATSSLNPDLGQAVEETLLGIEGTLIAISHRYYENVTEKYDYVIEIKNGIATQYPSQVYFEGGVAA